MRLKPSDLVWDPDPGEPSLLTVVPELFRLPMTLEKWLNLQESMLERLRKEASPGQLEEAQEELEEMASRHGMDLNGLEVKDPVFPYLLMRWGVEGSYFGQLKERVRHEPDLQVKPSIPTPEQKERLEELDLWEHLSCLLL